MIAKDTQGVIPIIGQSQETMNIKNLKIPSFLLGLFLVFLPFLSSAQAFVSLQSDTDSVAVAPELLYFEDQTGSQSFFQAQSQFKRFEREATAHDSALIHLSNAGSVYWLKLTVNNASDRQNWVLNFQPVTDFITQPVWLDEIAVYENDQAGKPIYTTKNNYVPMNLLAGKSSDFLIMVKTIAGLDVSFRPLLETEQTFAESQRQDAAKMTLSWIVISIFATASLIFFALSRMRSFLFFGFYTMVFIQGGMLTLDSGKKLYTVLMNFLSPVQVLPMTAAIISLCAVILTIVSIKQKAFPFLLKMMALVLMAIIAGSFFAQNILTNFVIATQLFAKLIILVTGIVLAVIALSQSFNDAKNFWLLPAWLLFGLQSFMSILNPLLLPFLHLGLLGVGLVVQIYTLWQEQEKIRIEQQQKLQMEMNQQRQQHEKENFMWERKLESERGLLNNAKQREALRSTQLAEAKAQADAANKAKSDFLAMITHEIRTPMTGIMGMVHLTAQTSLDDKQKEYMDTIQNAGETLLTLLNDVLDYSKLEKGAISVEKIHFGLRALVQAVVTLMSGRAHEKALRLVIAIDDSVPDDLNGDPNRIRQVLINLLSNAIKFTDQGSVTIEITRDSGVSIAQSTAFPLRVRVIDTGIGISKEAQEKLFSAYSQADASIARRFGGTGLGLNICRMLVQAMGGDVNVQSELGKGSVFSFTLILEKSSEQQANAIAQHEIELAKINLLNVLVVDDNPVNLKVIAGLLELDHHRVTTAESGTKALNELDAHDFDLIFMDIQMPGFDGLTITKAIRRLTDVKKANVPIFALTGMGRDEDEQACRAAGMNGILVKPIRVPAFKKILYDVSVAAYGHLSNEDAMKFKDAAAMAKNVFNDVKKTYDVAKDQVRRGLASDYVPMNESGIAAPDLTPKPKPVSDDASALLNVVMLKDLHDSLPADSFNEIFSELDSKADELVTGIIEGWKALDKDDVSEKAHNLRGMAGNFGLSLLSLTAEHIEKAIKAGHIDHVAADVGKLQTILNDTKAALQDWLQKN